MNHQIEISNLSELDQAVQAIWDICKEQNCFLFYGEMGVGKTTLITKLCHYLGVEGNVSSPTYSIVNEYERRSGQKIFHFDLYRLKSVEELMDIGFEDYLYQDAIVLIEWPEFGESFYEKFVKVDLRLGEDHKRIVDLSIEEV